MKQPRISQQSAWDRQQISAHLTRTTTPVRLATFDGDFPFICSLWYAWNPAQGVLECATHQSSRIVKLLAANAHCAFEIAPNEPPYQGVRGKGIATLQQGNATALLKELIERYLGSTNARLAQWLLGRADEEVVIQIAPLWITAWDYSARMDPAPPKT